METPPKKRLPLRWLTLAEIVGLAALVIAGLGYWDSHRERLQQDHERATAEAGDRQGADAHDLGQGQLAQRQALLLRRFGSLGHERDPCRAMRQPSSQSRHGLHWANTAATAA